jgi:hypothetical protein
MRSSGRSVSDRSWSSVHSPSTAWRNIPYRPDSGRDHASRAWS